MPAVRTAAGSSGGIAFSFGKPTSSESLPTCSVSEQPLPRGTDEPRSCGTENTMGKDTKTNRSSEDETISRIVRSLVNKYAWKFPGLVEPEELAQVAELAVAQVRRCWKPGPAKLSSWVYRAVNVSLFEATCRAWSPVYACRHNVRELLAVHRSDADDVAEWPETDPVTSLGGLEAVIDRTRAYRRLEEIVAAEPGGASTIRVLTGETTVRGLAAELGVSIETVRRRKQAVIDRIVEDPLIAEVMEAGL